MHRVQPLDVLGEARQYFRVIRSVERIHVLLNGLLIWGHRELARGIVETFERHVDDTHVVSRRCGSRGQFELTAREIGTPGRSAGEGTR